MKNLRARASVLAPVALGLLLAGCGGDDAPAVKPPPGYKSFVNTKEGLEGKLLEHYVDFSFSYPETWDLLAREPRGSNFAKVDFSEKTVSDGNYTIENFAVGHFSAKGPEGEMPKTLKSELVGTLSEQFSRGFPNYRKVSEGETKFGTYDGYELRFESHIPETPKGPITLWGRAVLLPLPGSNKGTTVILLASSLSKDVKSVQDLGTKGALAEIAKSFRMQP